MNSSSLMHSDLQFPEDCVFPSLLTTIRGLTLGKQLNNFRTPVKWSDEVVKGSSDISL